MGIRQSVSAPLKPDIKAENQIHSAVIYGKSFCLKTYEAREILRNLEIEPKVEEVNLSPQANEIEKGLFQLTGQLDYPVIFVAGKHVGSTKDLKKALKSGYLQMLVNKVKKEEDEEEKEDPKKDTKNDPKVTPQIQEL